MSGPQESDPAQPSPGQQPESSTYQPSSEPSHTPWQPPASGTGQPGVGGQPWQQPAYPPQQPGYPPQQYPGYPQPGQQPPYVPQHHPTGYPQYGPPAQYGPPSQHSSPGQYGPPGQYGQPPTQFFPPGAPGAPYSAPDAVKNSKRSLAIIGGVAGVLVAIAIITVLVLGFWKPGFFVTTKLDVNAAQSGVQKILSDEVNGYGAKNVTGVKCNNGQSPTVKKGGTFNCTVTVDGSPRQVAVTFRDDSGAYEVGRPK